MKGVFPMGKYDFDEFIDRSNTNSMNVESWRSYIFGADCDRVFPYRDDEFVRMWIADMEFAVAPEICDAIKERGSTGVSSDTPQSMTRIFTRRFPNGA